MSLSPVSETFLKNSLFGEILSAQAAETVDTFNDLAPDASAEGILYTVAAERTSDGSASTEAADPTSTTASSSGSATTPSSQQVTAKDVTENCLPILNGIRTSNLSLTEALGNLQKDDTLQAAAKTSALKLVGKTEKKTTPDLSCPVNQEQLKVEENGQGVVVFFEHSETFDCKKVLGKTYEEGLLHLQAQGFKPNETKYDPTAAPFNERAAVNVAYLMAKEATKVGCAVTENCTSGKNAFYCKFEKKLEPNTDPFSSELYKKMVARGPSAASSAVPSILLGIASFILFLSLQ